MSLLEKTMAKVAAEYARKIEGLRRDAGRIAEADALATTIGKHMGGTLFKPSALVTTHNDGTNSIFIHVNFRHDDFRAALAAAGLVVESETEVTPSRTDVARELHMRLAGFDTLIDIEYDAPRLQAAA